MNWIEIVVVAVLFVGTWLTVGCKVGYESTEALSRRIQHLEDADEAKRLIAESASYGFGDYRYIKSRIWSSYGPTNFSLEEFKNQLVKQKSIHLEEELAKCCPPKGKKVKS